MKRLLDLGPLLRRQLPCLCRLELLPELLQLGLEVSNEGLIASLLLLKYLILVGKSLLVLLLKGLDHHLLLLVGLSFLVLFHLAQLLESGGDFLPRFFAFGFELGDFDFAEFDIVFVQSLLFL